MIFRGLLLKPLLHKELQRFPSKADRRRAWEVITRPRYGTRLQSSFEWGCATTVLGTLVAFLALIIGPVLWELLHLSAEVVRTASLIGGAICLTAFAAWNTRMLRRRIWRELDRTGIPTCHACGYDRTGLGAERCPECGRCSADAPLNVVRAPKPASTPPSGPLS